MNITRNSCQKYVPNQLFKTKDTLQNEYHNEIILSKKKSDEIQFPNSQVQKSTFKKTENFRDTTNIALQSHSQCELKKHLSQSSTLNQPHSKSIYLERSISLQDQQNQEHKENLIGSLIKTKRKSNNKRNNLKQLFLQLEGEAMDDGVDMENHEMEFSSKYHKNQKNVFELSQDQFQQNEDIQRQRSIASKVKVSKISILNQSIISVSEDQDLKKNIQMLNSKNFHFLNNNLDFDSSSEEEGEEKDSSQKQSSSSQNDFQKIGIQIPKIRQRNNFFLNSNDLDLDDSQDSQQQNQQCHDKSEQNSQTDSIKEEKASSQCAETSTQAINVADFRRQYILSGEEYLKKSLPSTISIDLIVKRDKSKRHSENIEYHIYDSKTLRLLLIIIKKSSMYQVHAKTNVENPRAHPDLKYLTAKVETNFLGSQFTLKYIPHEYCQKESPESELAASICYETNFLGFSGPRKVSIYIPQHDSVKFIQNKSLEIIYEKRCMHRVQKYVNKQAKWNNEVQSYVLNLRGKAKLSSVKNFVIIKDNKEQLKQEQSFVIFGKVGKDIFNLSIKGPFSILQGVSIALSSFQRKFTCE